MRMESTVDVGAIADRIEIEALRAEFTDAVMSHDYDRLASLFTDDGSVRIPDVAVVEGRTQIRRGVERLQQMWTSFVQLAHAGPVSLDGHDTASGRVYLCEFGHLRDGGSHRNVEVYHDRYRRTADGWRFAERAYEVRYVDPAPLSDSEPDAATLEGGRR